MYPWIVRRLGLYHLIIFAALSLLANGADAQEFESGYLERFESTFNNGGYVAAYEPQEPIVGDVDFSPYLVSEPPPGNLARALVLAKQYAVNAGSSAFMVWQDGEVIASYYGAEIENETPLLSKSLSKPLGAIAIGRAIALGHIGSVDQRVADFLTEWQGGAKASITIRHLLDMRSGLLPQGFSVDPAHPWNRAYLSFFHDEVLLHDYPLVTKPGSEFGYSNASAELVALIIERATGVRYGQFLGNEVLAKIGAQGGSIWVDRPGGLAHSGCCMYLPAETWLRLGVLLLNQGKFDQQQLLPEGFVNQMQESTAQNPHYGMGVWVGRPFLSRRGFTGPSGPGPKVYHSEPYLDPALFLFDGNSNQVVYILPSYSMVILRLGPNPPKDPEWDNSYLPNLLVGSLLKPDPDDKTVD